MQKKPILSQLIYLDKKLLRKNLQNLIEAWALLGQKSADFNVMSFSLRWKKTHEML